MRFSAEPVAGFRALPAMVGAVCYWFMDPETKRSSSSGSEKTREPEKDAGHAPDHPLFT